MTHKVCISGYYGFDNFGDEMILKILAENLKNFKNPPEITVFSSKPDKTAQALNVKSVHTFKIMQILPALKNCSVLISGGGSLLQDKSSALSLLYYLFVIAAAMLFRKKTAVFAQGIGPVNNKFLKILTMLILKNTDYITVRDDSSLKLLQDNGIKHAEKCFDPFWNVNIKNIEHKTGIGIQLRNCSFMTEDFSFELAKNINEYFSDKKIFILSLQNDYDLDICRKFQQQLCRINPEISAEVIPNTSNDKILEDISTLEALIAMRYHACLAGIKAFIKVLPVNYDIKVKTLADEFHLESINSKDEISDAVKKFAAADIKYKRAEIAAYSYDFSRLEKFFETAEK